MTPKGHGVIRGRRNLLYYPNGHSELCGRFDLVYDPKRNDILYDPKGHGDLCGLFNLVYEVTGSLELTVTYFMTLNVTVTFVVGLT